jgi:hypothetical protein
MRRAGLALAVGIAGCTHQLPPVATPGPAVPPAEATAPAPGFGRVHVDVVDGPVQVSWVKRDTETVQVNDLEMEVENIDVQARCTSPCFFDLPLGRHLLAFPMRGSGGVELDHVLAAPTPTVYRRALGFRQRGGAGFVLGVLGAAFGGASFATGAALLPVGLAENSHGATLAGGITLGAGAVLTAISIWAIVTHPSTEQAGAGAQYGLP